MGVSRLTYAGGTNLDFPEALSEMKLWTVREAAVNVSDGAVAETVRTRLRDEAEIALDACASQTFLRGLASWWAWASRGLPYAFAYDTDTGGQVRKNLDATAAPGATVISLSSVTGIPSFGPARYYVVRSADRQRSEIVTITAVDPFAKDVTIASGLIYGYDSGDSLVSVGYFPQAVTLDDAAPFEETEGLLFNFRHRFAEAA